ncbi:MAG: RNA methyltransferase [Dehalococcoidia bacterium]|nr:RNA methyltransferase [Dehalococcoidia bacterium]
MSAPLKPLKWYRDLATRKGRLAAGAFAVEGDRAIRQIISAQPEKVVEILSVEKRPPDFKGYPVRLITETQFRAISSTRTPQGIMAVVRMPAEIDSPELPPDPGSRVLLLEDIQDPGNIGTLIRSAAAFGYSGVLLTAKSADPLSPKCVQSSAGTVMAVWLRRTNRYMELVRHLQANSYCLVAADPSGFEDPSVLSRREKVLLALGNEAAGLSKQLLNAADCRLRIPTVREKAESLNVAAAGAICMYLSFQRR